MELLESIKTVAGWFSAREAQSDIPHALVEKFAVFTATLHRQGIFHCDFSPRNVMVQGEKEALRFVMIDLEDVRFCRTADPQRCIQNLARFAREAVPYVSKRTVIQFLRNYIHEMEREGSAAGLMREIMRAL
jgi:tRNA A-37 threonylcarbamoyl transferase component Bud32